MPGSDELSSQEKLTRAINSNLVAINNNLETELRQRIMIRQQSEGQAIDAEKAAAEAAAARKGAQTDQSSVNSKIEEEIKLKEKSAAVSADGGSKMKILLKDVENAATKGAEVFDKAGVMLNEMVPRQLMENLRSLQTLVGGLSGPNGVFNAATGAMEGTNVQVNRFGKAIDDAYVGLYASKGAFADAFGSLPTRALGDLNTVMKEFGQLMSGGDGMVNGLKIAKAVTGDMILEFRALQKAMNLSTDEMQEFIHRGISRTGKASLGMVREAAVYSKRLAGITGDSAKMISQNITKIIGDTQNFGNVTVAEAARISVTLRQLGLGYGELSGMVGQYLSFEGAAESVSKLTTVFGVQMDAMDMMMLANEDQEQFLHRFRDQFLMTAKSVDDMTLAEKRMIKEATGLSDIQAVERLLDPDAVLSDITTLTGETDKGIGETQEIMEMLKDDIIDLQDITAYSSDRIADNINEKMRQPLRHMAIEVEQDSVRIARSFEKAIPNKAAEAIKYFGEGVKDFLSIDEAQLDKLGEILNKFAEGIGDIGTDLKDSDLGEEVGKAIDKVAGPGSAKSMSAGVSSAFDGMVKKWGEAVDLMIEKLKPLLGKSESDIGKRFRIGWMSATDNTVKEFKSTFTGQEGLASIVEGESKKAVDVQMKTYKTNIDAARAMLEKMKTDKGEYLAIATKKQKEAFSKQFELTEKQQAILNLETKEKLLKNTEDNWNAAFERAGDVVGKKGAKLYNKMTDISKEQLGEQLKDFSSVYSSMAREMGAMGVQYGKLSDEQKAYYAKQFKLGDDWEAELKQIFDSDSYKTGATRKKQGELLTDLITDMRKAGRSGKDINNEMADYIKQKYKLSRDQFTGMLEAEEGTDISSLVGKTLRDREEKLAAVDAAKATKAKEDEKKSSGGKASAASDRLVRAQIAASNNTTRAVEKNTIALAQIKAAIDGKEFKAPDVTVKLRGQDITNAVGANPEISEGKAKGMKINLST